MHGCQPIHSLPVTMHVAHHQTTSSIVVPNAHCCHLSDPVTLCQALCVVQDWAEYAFFITDQSGSGTLTVYEVHHCPPSKRARHALPAASQASRPTYLGPLWPPGSVQ